MSAYKNKIINSLFILLMALNAMSCKDEYVFNEDESTKFKVIFDTNGATKAIEDQVFYTKGTVVKPADPFKSSHVFLGWKQEGMETFFDFNKVLSIKNESTVIKLIAQFTAGFDVTFDCQDGTFDNGEKNIYTSVLPNTTVAAPAMKPFKTGDSFEAWCTDAAGTTIFDFNTAITKSTVLYARFGAIVANFDSRGGSAVNPVKVNSANKIVKPANPTRSGYTFIGWVKENGDVFDFNSTITETVQLFALWGMDESAFVFSNGVIKGLTTAFANAEYIEIPATIGGVSVTEVGLDAFNGNTKVKELSTPPSLKTISKNAFKGCTNLSKFLLTGVVTIGVDAFTSSGIQKINLPSTFISLSNNAFVNCHSLTEVHFPASFTGTGTGWTFWGCKNLSLIICDAVAAPALGGNDFKEWVNAIAVIPALKAIKVPLQSVNQYKEKWPDYAHLIVSQ
jgi:uncharacterized repeat protein (TIGR02543 family)